MTNEYQHLSNEIKLYCKINNLNGIGDCKNRDYS